MASKQKSVSKSVKKPGFLDQLKKLFSNSLAGFGKSKREADTEAEQAEERARQQQRKRDEFVRRRELESLRKMRHNIKEGQSNEFEAPPSVTGPSSDISQREATLRKINEIERMMSVDVKATKKPESPAKNRAFLDTQPMQLNVDRPVIVDEKAHNAANAMANAFKSTSVMEQMARANAPTSVSAAAAAASALRAPAAQPPQRSPAAPAHDDDDGGFMLSMPMMGFLPSAKAMAMEVSEAVSHDPVLEEAAILFANAEYPACEAVLKAAIAPSGSNSKVQETWRALFDFYRATGNQTAFESVGLDFVDAFETSAPNWINYNDLISKNKAPSAAPASSASYVCQPKIDSWAASQTAQFIESKLMTSANISMDVSKITSVDPTAAGVLAKAIESLSRSNTQVTLTDTRNFQRALASITPSMDPSVPKGAWDMRLELLRLLGKHEDYENVALEYTLTYEVSPTAWKPVNCKVTQSAESELSHAPESDDLATTGFGNDSRHAFGAAMLEGEVVDGVELLTPAMRLAAESNPVIVSCATLKRMDFASAGTLLNWVLELEGEGKAVILTDTHRLTAAFFNVIGIGGHARVSLRKE